MAEEWQTDSKPMAKDNRLWAPFPIEMDEHPKIIGLSDAAFRAVFEATFYSRRMTSDGFLDERVVLKRWGQAVADELSSNDPDRPSWVRVESGWQIHNFSLYHPLRAEIEEKRALVSKRRSEAGKNGAAKRWAGKEQASEWQTDSKAMASDSSETETETETSSSTKKRETASRGSRLSPDWLPSSEDVAKVKAECPSVDAQAEHPAFVDYWIAIPGAKGLKSNWGATWRNWMRRKQADATTGSRAAPIAKADANAAAYREIYGGDPNGGTRSVPALDAGFSS